MNRAVKYLLAGFIVAIAAFLIICNTAPSLPNNRPSLKYENTDLPEPTQQASIPPQSTSAVPAAPVPLPVASIVPLAPTTPPLTPAISSTPIHAHTHEVSQLPSSNEPTRRTVFGNGEPFRPSDLPESPLRKELEALPPPTLKFALSRLTKMSFHINDLDSLHVDPSGMPYYVCSFKNTDSSSNAPAAPAKPPLATTPAPQNIPVDSRISGLSSAATASSTPGILGSVPIASPPLRHSKPGATRVLFLDFNGAVITNTAWNSSKSITRWDCRPFDTDGDTNTFCDTEQTYIVQIWERVAEDYAPFNVDVTTEQPTNWTSKTGHALITPDTDATGQPCPHYTYGGIAYVDVFNDYNYSYNYASCYSPAFILPMSGNNYASTAEAASHELGHNMGLSHDGNSTEGYYDGHGSDDISWGPIMGTGYGQNVTQWSQGEYYDANEHEDDLLQISTKLTYNADDYGNTNTTASLITITNGLSIIAAGLITSSLDVDVFSFVSGVGAISLTAFPYRCANGTYGGNLDIATRLYNSAGTLVASNNPTNMTQAIINYAAPSAGTYYLHITGSGAGDPTNSTPTGYTSYGSIGKYFITGQVALATGLYVISPNGGESWYKSQTNTIRWSSGTNIGASVKIQLYRDGSLANTLTNSVTNTGSYTWIMTNTQLSATSHKIYISSVTQTSTWDASDALFTIATAPTTLLYETFETGSSRPSGWTETDLSGFANWTFRSGSPEGTPSSPYAGSYNACLMDYDSVSDISRLTTPAINMSGYTNVLLRFQHYMAVYGGDQDFLDIWVKTNASAAWQWVAGYSNSISSWTQQSISLPNPGTNYTIGFAGNAKWGYGVCLDNVEVLGIPNEITVATNATPLTWLDSYSLATSDDGALSDTDHDGMLAWQEWIAGTSPTQASSVLSLSNSWSESQLRILNWTPISGRVYSITWSTNLVTTPFQSLITNTVSGCYTDTLHSTELNGFYRINVQQNP